MKFSIETTYDQETLTAMAKAVRKTVRKKHSSRSYKMGYIFAAIAFAFVALSISTDNFSANTIVTLIAGIVMVAALIFEDKLNGYIAGKRMLKGTEKSNVDFYDEYYLSTTAVGETKFGYDNIVAVAKYKKYILFVFSKNHAQAYDMKNITNGTAKDFCNFIKEKTGKEIVKI